MNKKNRKPENLSASGPCSGRQAENARSEYPE